MKTQAGPQKEITSRTGLLNVDQRKTEACLDVPDVTVWIYSLDCIQICIRGYEAGR